MEAVPETHSECTSEGSEPWLIFPNHVQRALGACEDRFRADFRALFLPWLTGSS